MVEFEDAVSERIAQLEQEDRERYQRDLDLQRRIIRMRRPIQRFEMRVSDYYQRFCAWKEEMISVGYPGDESSYIDYFIGDLQWNIQLRVLERRSSLSRLIDAYYIAHHHEVMIRLDEFIKDFRAASETDEMVSQATIEIQRDADICISMEEKSIDNNHQAEPYAEPYAENQKETIAELLAHNLFDEMSTPNPNDFQREKENHDTDVSEDVELNETHEVFAEMPNPVTTVQQSCMEYFVPNKPENQLSDEEQQHPLMRMDSLLVVCNLFDEMFPSFRAEVIINLNNITLFDPGGDRKCAMSFSRRVVPGSFCKAHGTYENVMEGIDWGKIVMKNDTDRVLDEILHPNSLTLRETFGVVNAANGGFSSILDTKQFQASETVTEWDKVLKGTCVIACTPAIFIFPNAGNQKLDKEGDWQNDEPKLLKKITCPSPTGLQHHSSLFFVDYYTYYTLRNAEDCAPNSDKMLINVLREFHSSQNKGSGTGHQLFDEMLGSFPIKLDICDDPYRHLRLSIAESKNNFWFGMISMFVFYPGTGATGKFEPTFDILDQRQQHKFWNKKLAKGINLYSYWQPFQEAQLDERAAEYCDKVIGRAYFIQVWILRNYFIFSHEGFFDEISVSRSLSFIFDPGGHDEFGQHLVEGFVTLRGVLTKSEFVYGRINTDTGAFLFIIRLVTPRLIDGDFIAYFMDLKLDQPLISTRGRELGSAVKRTPMDAQIRSSLLEERSGASSYKYDTLGAAYKHICVFLNGHGLMFPAVYQRSLHVSYVYDFLSMIQKYVVSFYILEDKDVFERVGKYIIQRDHTTGLTVTMPMFMNPRVELFELQQDRDVAFAIARSSYFQRYVFATTPIKVMHVTSTWLHVWKCHLVGRNVLILSACTNMESFTWNPGIVVFFLFFCCCAKIILCCSSWSWYLICI